MLAHFVEGAISEPYENRHLMLQTINLDDNEDNRSWHSRSSKSGYSLQGKVVEKVRKNSYNDIAFPVETELGVQGGSQFDEIRQSNGITFDEVP